MAGRTNIVNTTKLQNVQQKTPVCKECQEIMDIIFSEEEMTRKSLTQGRSLLIFSYIICFLIGTYALIAGWVQMLLKFRGDENTLEYFQSGVVMGLGIAFLYFFSLIYKSDKRLKEKIEETE